LVKSDVICIGAAIVDVPLYPVDENIFKEVSYPIDDISMKIGGDAINEATIITRLGSKVKLMSAVGEDGPGYFIKKFAEDNGILTDCLHVDPKLSTSINVGLVKPDGERTFVTNRNGSLWTMGEESLNISEIKDAKLLSLASIFNNPRLNNQTLVKIFKKAKAENMIICADMVKSRVGETIDDIAECLSYVDYFFPNYEEAAELTGQTKLKNIANIFISMGVKNVVIKTGKEGCYIKNQQLETTIKAFKKDASVKIDTIGAGDNFASGFISELLRGGTIDECAYFGNAVAAVSIESLGATTGVKNRQQVEKMIEEYEKGNK
jgi:sugar/nucleoside kinase (ribokinase family)